MTREDDNIVGRITRDGHEMIREGGGRQGSDHLQGAALEAREALVIRAALLVRKAIQTVSGREGDSGACHGKPAIAVRI